MGRIGSNKFRFRNLALVAGLWGALGQVPYADAAVTITNMKWSPGHYLLNGSGNLTTQMNDFRDVPSLKGVIRNYLWSDLEGAVKGSYDFHIIRNDLNLLKANGKKLGIMIEYKYNNEAGGPVSNLPKYIRDLPNVTVAGVAGIAPFYKLDATKGKYNVGDHANFGHPQTLEGFSALLQHLATEFDNDPDVALMQFIESSVGVTLSSGKYDNFLNGGMLMEDAARQAFHKTPLFKNLNSPRNRLPDFIDNLTTNAMGFGGPDTFVGAFDTPTDSLTRTDGGVPAVYHYYAYNHNNTTHNNHLPISLMIHGDNFIYDSLAKRDAKIKNNRTPAAEINALLDFANTKLHPNYLVWQLFPTDPYYPAFKSKLVAEASSNPTSILGLIKACPTVYASCGGVTPPADTTPPTVSISNPAAGTIVASSVNVDINAADAAGVDHVELYANGVLIGSDNTAPYSIVYNAPAGVDVDVSLGARAVDINGNTADSANVLVLVRNAPPAGDTVGPSITLNGLANGEVLAPTRVNIWIDASAVDPSGVAKLELLINGSVKKTELSGALLYKWEVSLAPQGIYSIKVRATDSLGNVRNKTISVTVQQ